MIDLAHIHPMLVHFPLALFPVALGFQLYVLVRGDGPFVRGWMQNAALTLQLLAAAFALVAAVFGDIALDTAVDSGVSESLLETHEDLGVTSAVSLAVMALVCAWLSWRRSESVKVGWGFWFAGAAVFALLMATAWHGGHLVYDLGVNVHIEGR